MKKKITAFLFLLFLVGMAVAGLVKPDRSFSEQENRYLQTWPGISAASVADGSFMSRLETYLTDQSPLRDGMVRLHNSLLRWTGRREIQQVYFAPENRLIQLYDTNLTQARQNMEWINRWAEAWQGTQPISLVLAPTAAVVYRDQLPECNLGYDAEALTAMLQVGVSPDIRLVDLQAVMQEHRQEAIYFRSDHHWTMRGALYAWQILQPEAAKRTYEAWTASDTFRGSLYSQAPTLGYPTEAVELYHVGEAARMDVPARNIQDHELIWTEELAHKDQYKAFMGDNYAEMIIRNPEAPERSLLLFKDSYANALLPFLAENYRTIYVLDLRYYRQSPTAYAKERAVDEIMFLYNTDFFCTDNNFVWLTAE